METQLKHYGALIEKIRKDRKLSREDLCEDIMSKRNYQRFASGEVSISSDKIFKLVENLGLDVYSIQNIYKKTTTDEYSKLIEAFNFVSQWKFKEAMLIHSTIDKDSIKENANRNLYNLTNLLIKRHNEKILDSDFYSQIEDMIDFPNILTKKVLSVYEINSLFILSKKYIKKSDSSIIDFFHNLIKDYEKHSYWLIDEYISLIFTYITRGIYHFERFDDCIEFCNKGIEYCRKTGNYTGFENLLAYKSLSLNEMNLHQEAVEVAKLLNMLLILGDHEAKKNRYLNHIIEKLGITIDDL